MNYEVEFNDVGTSRPGCTDLPSILRVDIPGLDQPTSEGAHVDAESTGQLDSSRSNAVSFAQLDPRSVQFLSRKQERASEPVQPRLPGRGIVTFGTVPVNYILVGEEAVPDIMRQRHATASDLQCPVDHNNRAARQQD